jgi:hypothetical protein
MALALNLSVVERNDSQLVTFTDTSTGWGTEGDPNVTNLDPRTELTYSLIMDITINTSTEVIVCDQIDLRDLFGPFTTTADLVFPLDYTTVLLNQVTVATNTILPDGIWDITYKVQEYVTGSWVDIDSYAFSVLIYGDVKTQVYNRLRQVPNLYNSKILMGRDIQEPLLYYTFLQSIEKSAFVARKEELLSMLETLERLLLNGSNYPW